MVSELKPIDIGRSLELQRLVDEVRQANQTHHLQENGQDVALLVPVDEMSTGIGLHPRGKPTRAGDPLWNIVGIGASSGPTEVSANKHAYLAEAYGHKGA